MKKKKTKSKKENVILNKIQKYQELRIISKMHNFLLSKTTDYFKVHARSQGFLMSHFELSF